MIFVTLGSQKFQFNRLLKEIDKLIEYGTITQEVFAQIGYSDYIPKHYKYKDFLSREEFIELEGKADIVITHGGTGAIVCAVKKGKKVIAVPRLVKYGEHVDDHQLQIINVFNEQKFIYGISDCSELSSALKKISQLRFRKYISNTNAIIKSLEEYIEG